MSEVRLIDANALKLMKVVECAGHTIEYAAGWKRCVEYCKNDAPTVDAVPVVRCKDCRWGKQACGNIECTVDIGSTWAEYHDYEWFCPNGERR